MQKSNIEWIFNPDGSRPGYTFNPITGCLNGCFYCYARRLANGRLKQRYLANRNVASEYTWSKENISIPDNLPMFLDPFYPRFWEERLEGPYIDPTRKQHTKGIFVCDMGELFGDWLPREWQNRVFQVIRDNPWHRFYLLTKQPQNLIQFSPFPDNCFVGVTATGVEQYKQALAGLAVIEARIKYISFEPLLEYIPTNPPYDLDGINWVILGGQTQPTKQPPVGAVDAILNAAEITGAKVFMKNNLAWQFHRQEMPKE